MQKVRFISLLCAVTFVACKTPLGISGRYVNVYQGIASERLDFYHQPNIFEYFATTEGRIQQFASGTWLKDSGKILLAASFDTANPPLRVVDTITNMPNSNESNISIKYSPDPLFPYIKLAIILNGAERFELSSDTTLTISSIISRLNVRSYLSLDNYLLASPPHIDTLHSHEFDFSGNQIHRDISLHFNISSQDFYRISLVDTLTVRNSKELIWRGLRFRRVSK